MNDDMPTINESLKRIAAKLGALSFQQVPKPAHVAIEDLIVCYTIGKGRFSADKKYFSIRGEIFRMDGTADGHWAGENELLIQLSEVWDTPPPPPPPFNIPVPPVPRPDPQGYAKGTWTFGNGSALTAVGQTQLHAARFQNQATNFWISANQLISNGSGQFEGAQGLKIGGISILIPPGTSLENAEEVSVKSIDVFRIARKEFIGKVS